MTPPLGPPRDETSRTVTKPSEQELREALRQHGGSVTQTAAELGAHRVTVHKWMRHYGIKPQRVV